jgi:hypothetical protein
LNCKLKYQSDIDRKQKVYDLEIVALDLTVEFMSIDSENSLFKEINMQQIPNLIERSQFNKRRRKLYLFIEEVSTKLVSRFLDFEDYFIVDSMSLEIYKLSRQRRIKICKMNLKLLLQKVFVLLRTIGFTDINCTDFVL